MRALQKQHIYRASWLGALLLAQTLSVLFFCRSNDSVIFPESPCVQQHKSIDDMPPSTEERDQVYIPSYEDAFLDLIGPSDKRLPILEARYNLVWLSVPENVTSGDTPYEGVQCSFCPMNWTQQKQAPHTGKEA